MRCFIISYVIFTCVVSLSQVLSESQVIGYEGDSVTLRCDESNEVPIEGETPITEYLTSWSRLPDNRTGGNETLVARHIGQRNVFIAEEYEGRGLELTIRNGRLTIPEVQVRDEGRYRCIGAHRMPHETVLVVKVRPNIDITVDCGSEEVKLYCYVPRIRPTPTAVFWKLDDEEVEGENTFGMVDADYDVSSAWANITYDVDDGQMESAQCVVRAGGQEWSKDARDSDCSVLPSGSVRSGGLFTTGLVVGAMVIGMYVK